MRAIDPTALKTLALILLGVVSLVAPLVEMLVTDQVEPLSKFDLAATVIELPLIFWWYHVDKREHGYQAGPLMNAGIIAVCVAALPIYLIRSRGWKRGIIATLLAGLVLAATFALAELGEWLGGLFVP